MSAPEMMLPGWLTSGLWSWSGTVSLFEVGVGVGGSMMVFLETAPLYRYEYNGRVWMIEIPPIGGPVPVKADGDPYRRIPSAFWEAADAFMAEQSKEET